MIQKIKVLQGIFVMPGINFPPPSFSNPKQAQTETLHQNLHTLKTLKEKWQFQEPSGSPILQVEHKRCIIIEVQYQAISF